MLVAVLYHLLDNAAVAHAEVGVHAAAAAYLAAHLLVGVLAGVAQLYHRERRGAARALGRELAVVIGARCPIALNSRSASFEEKYNSLLVCALMSGGKGATA